MKKFVFTVLAASMLMSTVAFASTTDTIKSKPSVNQSDLIQIQTQNPRG